jgi:hypothetical protein
MNKTGLELFGLMVLAVLQAQAATLEWVNTGTVGEWSESGNWRSVEVQGSTGGRTDRVLLEHPTDHAEVTKAVESARLNIQMINGARLDVRANFQTVLSMDIGTAGASGGGVTQSGGLLIGRTLNLGASGQSPDFEAKYTLTGGVARFTTEVNIGKNGTFEIIGDAAEAQLHAPVCLTDGGTLSYTLAANGVTHIESEHALSIGTGARLSVDASSYAGGVRKIRLAEFKSLSGTFDAGNISITGLADGLSGEVTYDRTNLFLNILPNNKTMIGLIAF